jgi:hypothetical protein
MKLFNRCVSGGTYFTAPSAVLQGYTALSHERIDLGNTISVPLPNVKPLSKVASWQHCANALALLTQMGTGAAPRRY